METDESYSQFIEILVEKSNIGDHPIHRSFSKEVVWWFCVKQSAAFWIYKHNFMGRYSVYICKERAKYFLKFGARTGRSIKEWKLLERLKNYQRYFYRRIYILKRYKFTICYAVFFIQSAIIECPVCVILYNMVHSAVVAIFCGINAFIASCMIAQLNFLHLWTDLCWKVLFRAGWTVRQGNMLCVYGIIKKKIKNREKTAPF